MISHGIFSPAQDKVRKRKPNQTRRKVWKSRLGPGLPPRLARTSRITVTTDAAMPKKMASHSYCTDSVMK